MRSCTSPLSAIDPPSVNTLYDNLRTIQGAADIEWPEREPANRSQREKFRIGFFPP